MQTSNDTLCSVVYEKIRGNIFKGAYPPGYELKENKLIKEFKVSRTPIREALRRLEKDMVIVSVPHKGSVVIYHSLKDFIDLLDLREALECLAVRLATKLASGEEVEKLYNMFLDLRRFVDEKKGDVVHEKGKELHKFILRKANNHYLKEVLENSQNQIDMIMRMNARIPGRYCDAYKEHITIIESMLSRDEDAAETAMKAHIQSVKKGVY